MDEVDEGIPHIALCLQIHWKVEVVILALVCFIDHFEELHLLELIRDVPNHNGGPLLFTSHDPVEVYLIA